MRIGRSPIGFPRSIPPRKRIRPAWIAGTISTFSAIATPSQTTTPSTSRNGTTGISRRQRNWLPKSMLDLRTPVPGSLRRARRCCFIRREPEATVRPICTRAFAATEAGRRR
jgi:hypothetical protein